MKLLCQCKCFAVGIFVDYFDSCIPFTSYSKKIQIICMIKLNFEFQPFFNGSVFVFFLMQCNFKTIYQSLLYVKENNCFLLFSMMASRSMKSSPIFSLYQTHNEYHSVRKRIEIK